MVRNASCHDASFGEDVRGILAAAERLQLVTGVRREDRSVRASSVKFLEPRDRQVGFVCMVNGRNVELELVC